MADPFTMAAGLAMVSTATKAVGSMAGANADAEAAANRAKIAGVQADETTSSAMYNLTRSLGNIKAVLASSNVSINSPTSQALLSAEDNNSMVNLNKKISSLRLQQGQDAIDVTNYGVKSQAALMGGALGMAGDYMNYKKGN